MIDPQDLPTYTAGAIEASAHRAITRATSDYLQKYELTAMHWLIIGQIHESGKNGTRLTDLTQAMQTTLPYITTTINLLENKGIVIKKTHEVDSRIKMVTIAPKFKPTIKVIEEGLREALRERVYNVSNVTVDELTTYMNVLNKLAKTDK